MLTHADAWNRPARHEKTLTLSHSGWFTGPRAHTVIRVKPFDRCINSWSEITFLTFLPLAPCLHNRHLNQRSAQMFQLWAKTADRLWLSKGGAAGEREAGGQEEGEFAGTYGGTRQAKEGVAGAHHFQTRPRIPEGSSTAPGPLLLAAQAILPPQAMTSSSKTGRGEMMEEIRKKAAAMKQRGG